jgi:hypothetical protein
VFAALVLQRPAPDDALRIVATGEKQDAAIAIIDRAKSSGKIVIGVYTLQGCNLSWQSFQRLNYLAR